MEILSLLFPELANLNGVRFAGVRGVLLPAGTLFGVI
jgi:hypothetical protein